MADKTPKCPGWPHPYTVHTPDHGACEIDLAQHRWETQRKQTTMEERESRRGDQQRDGHQRHAHRRSDRALQRSVHLARQPLPDLPRRRVDRAHRAARAPGAHVPKHHRGRTHGRVGGRRRAALMPLPANIDTLTISQICSVMQGLTTIEAEALLQAIAKRYPRLGRGLQVELAGYSSEVSPLGLGVRPEWLALLR